MQEYDPSVDYCGPGESWLTKHIPNKILGVDINYCCYKHDVSWSGDEPRYKDADIEFRAHIKRKFAEAASLQNSRLKRAGYRLTGFFVSWPYYFSVRLGSLHNRNK
jgi:hypothetical protein